ncbi:MAG: DUF748 domain-containing protein [Bacteroidetes bacterium]|nr:DUF748 domain-containing protein [Bacteroidota bacterium]
MTKKPSAPSKKILIIIVALCLVLVSVFFILDAIANRKIKTALTQLPASIQLTYSSVHMSIIKSSLVIDDLVVKYLSPENTKHQHELSIKHVSANGIHLLQLLSDKKLVARNILLDSGEINLDQFLLDKKDYPEGMNAPFESVSINELRLSDIKASIQERNQEKISFEGNCTIESIKIDSLNKSFDKNNFSFGAFHAFAPNVKYVIADAYQSIHIKGLVLDSKKSLFHIDTCRIVPLLNKFQMGEKQGHQVDYIESMSAGIDIEKIDMMQLINKKLIAEKISVRQNRIYAFRDRRLPLETKTKPLPAEYFKTIPLEIRVKDISIGNTYFEYEEFPKKGKQTGILKILHLRVGISPFINHPMSNDPAYMKMKVEGSLMGSGSVRALMQFPLQKQNEYEVDGAFNDLDLTTLNASAENLGKIHIESGLLNSLSFQFRLDEEKSTGKIVGEYHQLVIDKLREKPDEKKKDKFKSFFLKNFIVPKNKDKTLAESKRTGKVDYKRDPSRYFSYYLLHSLLTGVKSSFSLGFLLPG